MENGSVTPNSTPVETIVRPGIATKVFKIFYEPSAVFPALTKKTDWIIPLIIITLIGGFFGHYVRPILAVEQEKGVMKNMEKYRDNMTTEQFNDIMENIQQKFDEAKENKFQWYFPPLAIAMVFLFFVIISVIGLLSGNFILGGKANFWIIMNAVAFAALIGLLGDVIRNALIISKGSASVYIGLGLLKPVLGGDSFLFYLFRQIDIFSIWRIAVTCIGLGAVYKIKWAKFGYVFFTVWLLFVVLVAVGNIFAGGTIIY